MPSKMNVSESRPQHHLQFHYENLLETESVNLNKAKYVFMKSSQTFGLI